MAIQKHISKRLQRETMSAIFKSSRRKKLRKLKKEERVKHKRSWEREILDSID